MAGEKQFNITGPCIPSLHYMVDTSEKIDEIVKDYIEPGKYFTINRARQFGKTTTLELIYQRLREKYIVIDLSFEGREDYFESRLAFATGITNSIARIVAKSHPDIARELTEPVDTMLPFDTLDARITDMCERAGKQIVLTVDEVDKAANNAVFIAFLGLLRDKYIERSKRGTPTFHSVILSGVHDIKNLKMKLRPEERHSYNSPWNIAANFKVDMSFSSPEIATMLDEYERDRHTGMDIADVSARIYYYTSGYPFLVSLVCKTIDDDGLEWTREGVDEAEKRVVKMRATLFDDVIKNLVNNPDFAELVKRIVLMGARISYEISNPSIDLGMMYGILSDGGDRIRVSNIILETVILNYFTSLVETSNAIYGYIDEKSRFIRAGKLDMSQVLNRFAAFMKSEYRDEDGAFIEREGRLLFLSFLKPIINGAGHYVVEPETRGSRRMDVVVFYAGEEHIVEIKIWRGERAAKDAYAQLTGYLRGREQKKGYLLSFCDNKTSPREGGTFTYDGIEIAEVIVAYRDKE